MLEELSVEDLVHRLLNGQQILDSDQILENLKNLFLLEVRSSLMLGCEILAVCILIGMPVSYTHLDVYKRQRWDRSYFKFS